MTLSGALKSLEVTIDLVKIQRDLALQALKNIATVDTVEEARGIARGVAAAIDACDDDREITITTTDYTAADDEGRDVDAAE